MDDTYDHYFVYGLLNEEGKPIASSIRRTKEDVLLSGLEGTPATFVLLLADVYFDLLEDHNIILNSNTEG